jgi:hypothetical protein
VSTTDLCRACFVRVIRDINHPGVEPGDVEVRTIDGTVWGYAFACPGCGSRGYLALSDLNPGPCWTVAAGDIALPTTVTLTPSILDTIERGGCGWHGYLRGGRFVPC